MATDLTADPVTLTTTRPSGLVVPVTGQGALRAVTPLTGHPHRAPVTLTGHPTVTPDPVTLTAPEVTTLTDTAPAPAAPVTPVTRSPGHGDQVTAEPRRRGLFRRRSSHRAAAPAPAAPRQVAPEPVVEQPTVKAKPDPLPLWLNILWLGPLWGVTTLVTYLAAYGQVEAAKVIGILDHRKFLVPTGLELVAVVLFTTGYVVGRQGFSPWPAWCLGLGVGYFAVKQVHDHAPNHDQGVLYGAFTAGALILWLIKLMYALWKFRRDEGSSAKGHLKFGKLWRDSPRLTWHASIIGRRFQLDKIATAMEYAEVKVATLDDAKDANKENRRKVDALRKDHKAAKTDDEKRAIRADIERTERKILNRKLRSRTAWRVTQAYAGRPVAQLPSFAGVDRIALVEKPKPVPAPDPTPTPDPTPATPTPTPRPKPAQRPSPAEGVEEVVQEWAEQVKGRKPRPANAPVSPAPAGDVRKVALQQYDAVFKLLDLRLLGWKTREAKVSAGDLFRLEVRDAEGKKITGKPTLNKIAWLVETESVRADQVPAAIWAKYGWSRESRAEA